MRSDLQLFCKKKLKSIEKECPHLRQQKISKTEIFHGRK